MRNLRWQPQQKMINLSFSKLLKRPFWDAFYADTGRKREYSLEGFMKAMLIQHLSLFGI